MSATLQAKIIADISISDIKNEKQGIMSLITYLARATCETSLHK